MEFNIKKCNVMEFGKTKQRISEQYKLGEEIIKKAKLERNLGVFISKNISPEKHINKIIGENYNLLKNIIAAFTTWMKKW